MSLNDPLANVLSHLFNEDKLGKKEIIVQNNSKLIKSVLQIFFDNGYIGEFEEMPDNKGGKIKINLLSKINKCGVIKPRFNVKAGEFEKFEKRYLPAYGFGMLILSTNKGVMTQAEAAKKQVGGKLLAYVY